MIITAIQGGLGNQMFQYACAQQLAIRNEVELKLDIGFYQKQNPGHIDQRQFELDIFNIKKTIATTQEVNLFFPNQAASPFAQIYNRVRRKYLGCTIIKENSNSHDELVKLRASHIYLKGYWQSERFFAEIPDVIHEAFSFKHFPDKDNADYLNRIATTNSVAVHIRRGDFLKNPIHGTLPVAYYQQAIKYIQGRVKDPVYFIFSDDLDWAKDNLSLDKEVVYVSHNWGKQNHEDLRLMKSCKHNIIANSSFSWWAGWLNRNSDKLVIAPVAWFRDMERNAESGKIIPETWIRM